MCCLPSTNTMQVEGQTRVLVRCGPLELLNFLKRDYVPMNLMCERAGMFENRIIERAKLSRFQSETASESRERQR